MNVFLLREPLYRAFESGEGLAPLVRRMLGVSLLCALAYGAVLGGQLGGWQVFSSPVKLPLILLGTGVLCSAALYVLLALAGERLRWLQVIALALCSVSASAVAMAALLPIAAFWTFAFGQDRQVTTWVHTGAFFVAGAVGARFCLQAAGHLFRERRVLRVMLAYMLLYGLVAQQMAWIFRPHFHATTVFMRPLDSGGSALQALAETLFRRLR